MMAGNDPDSHSNREANQQSDGNSSGPPERVRLRFAVSDTGSGLSPAQVAQLFRPFEQVGDAQSREAGTGLGLAISQRIVKMMGGRIEVESEPGHGSCFAFAVDVVVDRATTAAAAISPRPHHAILGYVGDRKTLLVVDDRLENRLVLQSLLEAIGFAVLVAEDGRQGLHLAQTEHPDAIICDLVMPGINGFELVRQVRQHPTLAEVPIVISSASVFEFERAADLQDLCQGFLPKPVRAEIVLKVLEQVLDLQWIDAGSAATQSRRNPPDSPPANTPPATLTTPPNLSPHTVTLDLAVRDRLQAALDIGDIASLQQEAEQLKITHPDCAAWADQLRELADRFDDTGIAALLESTPARV